jgi:hypothetical protein
MTGMVKKAKLLLARLSSSSSSQRRREGEGGQVMVFSEPSKPSSFVFFYHRNKKGLFLHTKLKCSNSDYNKLTKNQLWVLLLNTYMYTHRRSSFFLSKLSSVAAELLSCSNNIFRSKVWFAFLALAAAAKLL